MILPLMHTFDLMLFIKSYKSPHAGFDINYISFATGNTRLDIHHKLIQTMHLLKTPAKIFWLQQTPQNMELSPSHKYGSQPSYNQAKATHLSMEPILSIQLEPWWQMLLKFYHVLVSIVVSTLKLLIWQSVIYSQ